MAGSVDHRCARPRKRRKRSSRSSKGYKLLRIDKRATLIGSESRWNSKLGIGLELPQELGRVHHTFHVSNLKKCYADEPLAMPLEGVHIDETLQFVEEPVDVMEREIKRLERSRIPLVKVRWNSRRGPEFTWEREDSSELKYPHLFKNRASSPTTRS
nr:putative reverse transcriptase domain-containing protein [Tanacetum cinerariifolium]